MEINYQLINVEDVAQQLLKSFKSKTILFNGSMGVGKTTLIKAIAKALGSNDDISSPTFSIVNEYELEDDKIFHFDLYRIKNLEEAYNFGIEDYLDSGNWVFIEWPELIEKQITEQHDAIFLEINAENNRTLTLKN